MGPFQQKLTVNSPHVYHLNRDKHFFNIGSNLLMAVQSSSENTEIC